MTREEGVMLKGNFEQRRSGWDQEEIKHVVSNVGVRITLKLFAPFGLLERRRWKVPWHLPNTKMDLEKGTVKERKGKKICKFPLSRNGRNEGISEEHEVNVATRQVDLSGVLGSGKWEEKDWRKECSAIVDAGFNGGGLCSHAWMQRYVVHLGSFNPKPIY